MPNLSRALTLGARLVILGWPEESKGFDDSANALFSKSKAELPRPPSPSSVRIWVPLITVSFCSCSVSSLLSPCLSLLPPTSCLLVDEGLCSAANSTISISGVGGLGLRGLVACVSVDDNNAKALTAPVPALALVRERDGVACPRDGVPREGVDERPTLCRDEGVKSKEVGSRPVFNEEREGDVGGESTVAKMCVCLRRLGESLILTRFVAGGGEVDAVDECKLLSLVTPSSSSALRLVPKEVNECEAGNGAFDDSVAPAELVW